MRVLLGFCLAVLSSAANEAAEPLVFSTVSGRLNTDKDLHDVRIVLNGGAYTAIPRADGSFIFHAVASGSYLLDVQDTLANWPQVRLDVSAKAAGKVRALYTHSRQPLQLPMLLDPIITKPQFFEKREGFQWTSMLKQPMVLMMGVTMLLMFAMPKMMANMDPEQLKEMQEMQKGGLASMLDPEKMKEKQRALEGKRKER
jgi:hypothetical protein